MSTHQLTDKTFWNEYWKARNGIAPEIKADHLFHDIFKRIFRKNNITSAIHLGGYPGHYSIFLKKYHQIQSAFLDYYIHENALKSFLKENGLDPSAIYVIKADLFKHIPRQQYDLVYSIGLVEHFTDTQEAIARHLSYLNPGGTLLIIIPNFRGLNGRLQQKYDPENYSRHNINCMSTGKLHHICRDLGLEHIRSYHYGKFSAWLENYHDLPGKARTAFKLSRLTGTVLTKLIPFDSRLLSPYIVLEAQLPAPR